MFHAQDGLNFERLANGDVRILKQDNVTTVFTSVVSADIWASVIATVSAGGEENYRWYLAKDFHASKGRQKLVAD